jgi:hypothetical protein
MIRALTLDPGGTTGYCLSVIEDPATVFIAYTEQKIDLDQLWRGLGKLQVDKIICEDFEYRNRARAGLDLTPVKMIGVVELYGLTDSGAEIFFQNAATGKGHYNNEKLKQQELYLKGKDHGRDACRHYLQWLTFGPGYKYIQEYEPTYKLVQVPWLLGAYWDHMDLWV